MHVTRDMTANIVVWKMVNLTPACVTRDMCWMQTTQHVHVRTLTDTPNAVYSCLCVLCEIGSMPTPLSAVDCNVFWCIWKLLRCRCTYVSWDITCMQMRFFSGSEPCAQRHDCQQICEKSDDSYICKCRYGYVLNADQKTCSSKTLAAPEKCMSTTDIC